MSQGKPRKAYLLKCAKEDHKPLDSYSKAKTDVFLAEFLSCRLEHSPELIGDLIKEFREKNDRKHN